MYDGKRKETEGPEFVHRSAHVNGLLMLFIVSLMELWLSLSNSLVAKKPAMSRRRVSQVSAQTNEFSSLQLPYMKVERQQAGR